MTSVPPYLSNVAGHRHRRIGAQRYILRRQRLQESGVNVTVAVAVALGLEVDVAVTVTRTLSAVR